jgi:hypothetical protein
MGTGSMPPKKVVMTGGWFIMIIVLPTVLLDDLIIKNVKSKMSLTLLVDVS